MFSPGKSWGRGAIRSVPPACVFPGLTIQLITFRTSCSQPAWSLFCYKSEVNRFYSSYKSVTKATVLISIINIHNSSSPAWQASWATLHKNWTLGIFMSCVLRSLVVWSWTLKTCRRLPGHPQETKLVTRTNTHIYLLYEVPISTSQTTKVWRPPFPLNPAYITYLGKQNTQNPQCQLEPDSWLGQALAQFPEDCNSEEGVFQRQGHIKLLNTELSHWFRRGS